jgi:hypothetical protein
VFAVKLVAMFSVKTPAFRNNETDAAGSGSLSHAYGMNGGATPLYNERRQAAAFLMYTA